MLPLAGVRVVAIEQAVAAPFASRQLADLGAEVIKIERPGSGDFARHYDTTVNGMASHFVWLNRGKKSLTVDMKSDTGKDIVRRLVSAADVVVQNLAPGALARLGFGWKAVQEINPRLILCNITGYGVAGQFADRKAYDLLIQSEVGFLSVTGTRETPSKAGISIADIAAGMYAYSGILSALLNRASSQQGAELNVSMFDALGEWMGFPAYFTAYGNRPLARSGARHAAIAPYGPFTAGADGRQVMLGIQNEREWKRFCEHVLARPDMADDARFDSNSSRVENRDALDCAINQAFAALTAAEISELLERHSIANARINTVEEFWNHAELDANHNKVSIPTPSGEIDALLPPVRASAWDCPMEGVPALGANTEEILDELGYDKQAIRNLKVAGTV